MIFSHFDAYLVNVTLTFDLHFNHSFGTWRHMISKHGDVIAVIDLTVIEKTLSKKHLQTDGRTDGRTNIQEILDQRST